jgi:glycolate oxidase iron-sulfur subunit
VAETAFESLKPLVPLMDKCVHCGFCLQTCPSYVLLGSETDSPRGRIYAMRAGVEGRITLTAPVVEHFDTCLGCMACETACPSGVRYAPLIEQTRATVEAGFRRPWTERLFRRVLFSTLPFARRLRALAFPLLLMQLFRRATGLLRLLPARVRSMLALAPDVHVDSLLKETPAFTPAVGTRRLRVGLLTGCVQRAFFGAVNRATASVLAAEGCDVTAPTSQGCCGALALHAGEAEDARAFARALITAFDKADLDVIAVNAAGCGSAMKEYGHLLAGDPAWADQAAAFARRVKDFTEVLTMIGPPRAHRSPLPLTVAYHDACHLGHAQGIRREPRDLLNGIPGLVLVPVAEADLCCGSAGIFNLTRPEMAEELGRRKATRLSEAKPDLVVTSNPGCILQIRAAARKQGFTYGVAHIAEVLDASISGKTSPGCPVSGNPGFTSGPP